MLNYFLRKYNTISMPLKMSFWMLICSFLQKGIGLIATPIYTRIMLDEEFGRFSVYNSWQYLITVFATLNISGNCFMRGLVIYNEKKDQYTSSVLGLSTVIILITYIVFIIVRSPIEKVTGINQFLITMMFSEMFLTTTFNFWMNRQRVEYRFKSVFVVTIFISVLRPVFSVLAIMNSPYNMQVEARASAIVQAEIVAFGWIYIYLIKKGKQLYSKSFWTESVLFCIPLIPHYLASFILSQSDRIMIDKFCGSAEAGYYSLAYSIGMVMLILNSAVSSSFIPWLYKRIKDRQLDRIGNVSYGLLIMIASINLILVGIAPEILRVMAPSNYRSAIFAIPPIVVSVYFMFMYDLFASFQFFYKKTKGITCATFVSASLNILLNYLFINKFGYIAAGYTTLACYIVYALVHYHFMKRVSNEYLDNYEVYNGKIIIGIGLGLIITSGIMTILYKYIYIRFGFIVILTMVLYSLRKRIKCLIKSIRS